MRLEGWEGRLNELVEQARGRAYALGEWDCFKFSCEAIKALTGVDRWPEFAGYKTRREMLAGLAAHGSTFEDAGDWFFGCARKSWKFARRGDVACVSERDVKHLGVVLGDVVALLSDEGLLFVPVDRANCVWSVG